MSFIVNSVTKRSTRMTSPGDDPSAVTTQLTGGVAAAREYSIVCGGSVSGRGGDRDGDGGPGRGPALWRVASAELVATALLLLLGCLPGCSARPEPPPPLLHRALASGLLVALLVQCVDHISGAHMNPTVTLAAVLSGRVGARRATVMCAAQVVGALAGVAALRPLAPGAARLCLTAPAPHLTALQAALVEGACGAGLALASLAAWDARTRRLRDSWPLRLGFAVTALTLAAGELTGASMNPARSLAPALLARRWDQLWVYCVGPLGGACAAVAVYACAWRAPRSPRAPRC